MNNMHGNHKGILRSQRVPCSVLMLQVPQFKNLLQSANQHNNQNKHQHLCKLRPLDLHQYLPIIYRLDTTNKPQFRHLCLRPRILSVRLATSHLHRINSNSLNMPSDQIRHRAFPTILFLNKPQHIMSTRSQNQKRRITSDHLL